MTLFSNICSKGRRSATSHDYYEQPIRTNVRERQHLLHLVDPYVARLLRIAPSRYVSSMTSAEIA